MVPEIQHGLRITAHIDVVPGDVVVRGMAKFAAAGSCTWPSRRTPRRNDAAQCHNLRAHAARPRWCCAALPPDSGQFGKTFQRDFEAFDVDADDEKVSLSPRRRPAPRRAG